MLTNLTSSVPGQVYRLIDVIGPPVPATDKAAIKGQEAQLTYWQAELTSAQRAAEVEAKLVAGMRDTLAIFTSAGENAMQAYWRDELAQEELLAASARDTAERTAQDLTPKIAQLTELIARLRAPTEPI